MAEKSPNKELLDKIQAKLECSICLTDYTEPKLLPCFHIFCKKCLEPLVVQDRDGLSLQCPICRHSIQLPPKGVSGLQSDFHVDYLFEIRNAFQKANQAQKTKCEKCAEDRNATGFCRDCGQFICDACTTVHRKWKEFKSHDIISLEKVQTEAVELVRPKKQVSFCPKHPECDLRIFCETCSELICTDCTIGDHQRPEHSYKLVTDAFLEHKDEIVASLRPVKEQLSAVTKALQAFEERVKEIDEQRMTLEAAVHKEINVLQQALEQRRTELISKLDHLTQLKLKDLNAKKDQVQLVQLKLSSCIDYVEGGLKTGTEGEVLAMKAPVMKQIEQLSADFNPATMQPEEEANLELITLHKQELRQSCQHFGNIVVPDSISPEYSYARGEGLKQARVGDKAFAIVTTMNYANGEYTHPTNFTAELVHYNNKANNTVQCDIQKQQNVGSRYKITYQPTHRGKHELHIKINGKEIRDSPYTSVMITPSLQSLEHSVRIIEKLSSPNCVTTNSQNQIIITELDSHCVHMFSPEGKKIHSFGSKGAENGQFCYPYGVTVGENDSIYVMDNQNHRIQKFTSDGIFIKSVQTYGCDEQFHSPWGLCYNPLNNKLYICDTNNHRVIVLNTDLTYNSTIGREGTGDGELKCPADVTVNSNGDIYVTDFANNRLQVFDETGDFLCTISMKEQGQSLHCPFGIAVDSNDTVYVTEQNIHCVSVYTAKGKYLMTLGSSEGRQFKGLNGIHIDRNDSILLCDAGKYCSRLYII